MLQSILITSQLGNNAAVLYEFFISNLSFEVVHLLFSVIQANMLSVVAYFELHVLFESLLVTVLLKMEVDACLWRQSREVLMSKMMAVRDAPFPAKG